MKLKNLAKGLVLGLAVLLATSAFAATNKGSLRIGEAIEINGQTLPAGEYQVRWEGAGPNVELSFIKNNKAIVKTQAKAVELPQAPDYDSAILDHTGGKATMSQIQFAGKKTAFAIGSSDRASLGTK